MSELSDMSLTGLLKAQAKDFEDELLSLRAENARLREAMEWVAMQDDIELALDPQWAKRMANAALSTDLLPVRKK